MKNNCGHKNGIEPAGVRKESVSSGLSACHQVANATWKRFDGSV